MSSPLTSSQIFGSFCSSPGSTPSPTVLRLSRTWSIICPPAKKAIVAGVLVPTVKGALTLGGRLMLKPKSRRLTIEIHGPENSTQANIISPIQRGLHRDTQTVSTAFQLSKELLEDDRIVVRILKRRRAWGFHRDPEDSSDSESDNESTSNKDWNMDGTPKKEPKDIHVEVLDDGWVEYRKYGMDEIVDEQLTGRNKEVFEATMGLGANQERREFRFESEQQGKFVK